MRAKKTAAESGLGPEASLAVLLGLFAGLRPPAGSRPGPGGTVAAIVPGGALATPEGEVRDATLDEFRRTWKYGFFVRCLVELVLEDSRRADAG